jgi:hypothetical protein
MTGSAAALAKLHLLPRHRHREQRPLTRRRQSGAN